MEVKILNVSGIQDSFRAMRYPLNSESKDDSGYSDLYQYDEDGNELEDEREGIDIDWDNQVCWRAGKNNLELATKLVKAGTEHSKFTRGIVAWMDITAPRYWWQQMSTYRIGNSFLSESTMYTITKKELTQENFESSIPEEILNHLNQTIKMGNLEEIKNILPEGFLQRRIMVTNYKALKNILDQRHNHKLQEWRYFCKEILNQLQFSEFLKRQEEK